MQFGDGYRMCSDAAEMAAGDFAGQAVMVETAAIFSSGQVIKLDHAALDVFVQQQAENFPGRISRAG